MPWPGPAHPAASNLVATSAGAGGTWLVPAAEARRSRWLSPGALALGRLPSAEPQEGVEENVQESVGGQLRGRHSSTREQRLRRRPNPSDLIKVLTKCVARSSFPHTPCLRAIFCKREWRLEPLPSLREPSHGPRPPTNNSGLLGRCPWTTHRTGSGSSPLAHEGRVETPVDGMSFFRTGSGQLLWKEPHICT